MPLLGVFCEFIDEGHSQVSCQTTLDDHMVTLTYICSYDGGPPVPCITVISLANNYYYLCVFCILIGGPTITIDRASFSPGPHTLTVTVRTESDRPISTSIELPFQGDDGRNKIIHVPSICSRFQQKN